MILPNTKKAISLITEVTCDTREKITSSKEMANMLNNYFSEIGHIKKGCKY